MTPAELIKLLREDEAVRDEVVKIIYQRHYSQVGDTLSVYKEDGATVLLTVSVSHG